MVIGEYKRSDDWRREAAGRKGHERMGELLMLAHELDATRLYATSSNPHCGAAGCDEGSDFHTAAEFEGMGMNRGAGSCGQSVLWDADRQRMGTAASPCYATTWITK